MLNVQSRVTAFFPLGGQCGHECPHKKKKTKDLTKLANLVERKWNTQITA